MDVHWCLYDIKRVDVLWRVGIGVRGGEGGGERGDGREEGRIEYIWHTTTYVGRKACFMLREIEVNSTDEIEIYLVFRALVNGKLWAWCFGVWFRGLLCWGLIPRRTLVRFYFFIYFALFFIKHQGVTR
jgi:hypothetical protein